MTLRLHKVTKQIEQLRENAVERAQRVQTELPKAREAFDRAAQRSDLYEKARAEAESGDWDGAMPAGNEALASFKEAPALPEALALVAVDGSQVYPDHHAASLFYAINIGFFLHRSDTGETDAGSDPEIVFEEEAIHPDGNLISQTILNARRTVEEMATLARMAQAEKQAAPGRAVLALADGGLALRIDEKAFPPAERGALQNKFFAAIDRLAAEKIPVAGYISRPGGSPVLALLELAQEAPAERARGRKAERRTAFPDLDDSALFERLLPLGSAVAAFRIRRVLEHSLPQPRAEPERAFLLSQRGARVPGGGAGGSPGVDGGRTGAGRPRARHAGRTVLGHAQRSVPVRAHPRRRGSLRLGRGKTIPRGADGDRAYPRRNAGEPVGETFAQGTGEKTLIHS